MDCCFEFLSKKKLPPPTPFSHGETYNPNGCVCATRHVPVVSAGLPRVLISPAHYIQGANCIDSLGRYVAKIVRGCDNVGLFITEGGLKRMGDRIKASFAENKVKTQIAVFPGVCSYEEADAAVGIWGKSGIKAVVAIGGGSCHDCGKLVAYKLNVPMVVVSTLAATDAPCSALSIIYTPDGGYKGGEVYPQSPNLVVVDTQIVAGAGKRALVSGLGDALATFYEARTVYENPNGTSMLEARPTTTAFAIGTLCKDMLYENGLAAIAAVEKKTADDALEKVVEANTLLSGLGFESGGLAMAHATAQALSWIPSVHKKHQHGEMVAMGLLTQLVAEGRSDDLERVGKFLCEVGLPCCHEQIHFDASDSGAVEKFVETTLAQWFCHNEPFEVTKELVLKSWAEVNKKGLEFRSQYGDAAYKAIHEQGAPPKRIPSSSFGVGSGTIGA